MKNKLLSWGNILVSIHCVAEDSRIPKMPVINPLQALVHLKTQKKKTILHGLSIPKPNFSELAFFGE
jgi:hypothetical protein